MKPIPIKIPPMRDHAAGLAALEDRRAKIAAAIHEKERARFELARSDPAFDAPPTDPGAGRIAELLGEAAPTVRLDRRAELGKLAGEIRDFRTAADLLDNQIRAERSKASAAIREALRPEYRLRIRAVCDALRQVHSANLALADMQTALQDSGVEWGALGVPAPRTLGGPTDPYSPVAMYFRESVDLGHIARNEIPAELRQ